MHGGAAPQVRARREARIALAAALATGTDAAVDRDPVDALLDASQTADRVVGLLKAQLDGRALDATILQSLGEWLDRLGRLAKAVVDGRLDERRTRVAERDGAMVAAILTTALTECGVDATSPEVRAIVVEVLTDAAEGRITPLPLPRGAA
jgi:PAS domain-containing protein